MSIKQLVTKDRVLLIPNLKTKKRALELISKALCQQHPEIDQQQIFNAFIERERLGSTALGHGVALPHIRSDLIQKPIAALLVTTPGVDFDSPDQQPVNLILGLIGPDDNPEQHLQILAEAANFFENSNTRQALLDANSETELFERVTSEGELVCHD